MRHITIILVTFLLLTSLSAFSQAEQDKDAPQIEFDKKVHNYGTILKGSDGNCVFEFKNTGKKDLILKNVRSSCGCTVPKWTREPVKKRKKGNIRVRYNTNIVGNFRKTVTVYSNATNSPIRLTIKGKVVRKLPADAKK